MSIEEAIVEAQVANRVASFIVPLKEERIFLTERVKDPYKGFYCMTGGKRVFLPNEKRYETPEETALREFCEEKYSGSVLSEQLRGEDLAFHYLGFVFDEEFGFICHASLACFDGMPEFVLKQDEVRRKRNLDEIKYQQINPITQHVLDKIRHLSFHNALPFIYDRLDLYAQIPQFADEHPYDLATKKYCRWEE